MGQPNLIHLNGIRALSRLRGSTLIQTILLQVKHILTMTKPYKIGVIYEANSGFLFEGADLNW